MSQDTKSVNKDVDSIPRYYGPDERLVDWFRKRLELDHEKKDLLKNLGAGGKLPNGFQKRMKASGARKAEILEDIIFQSMANLIYFFEAIAISPKLNELFEKDIIKLLDPRFVKKDVKALSMGLNTSSYRFRLNNFARLVSTALAIDDKKGVKDFRIALLYQLQSIVRDHIRRVLDNEYGFRDQITKSANEDFDNTIGWLAVIAKSISDKVEQEPDRIIGFQPIWLSNKADLRSLEL